MNVPFGNSYIKNWENHSNLPGKQKISPYIPSTDQQQLTPTSQQQQPLPLSPVEQAVLNLSKVVGTIVEEQKVLNIQTNQRIEAVESSLNGKLDNMHSEISKLSNQLLQISEKEKAPFQGQQYQNMVNEIGLTEAPNARIDEVKAVVTLRSGKELKPAVPELVKSAPVVAEPLQEEHKENDLPLPPTDSVYILPSPAPQSQPKTPTSNAQATYNPLSVYILPAANSKPTASAPKVKSNPLSDMQKFKKLVATVHAFATTSKTMATAHIAWHSGWFGCRFGLGASEPRHY